MPPLVRRFWTQPRRIVRELLAVDDSPHAVAAGATVGMFIGLTPTVGLQMVLVALLSLAAKGKLYFNRAAALLLVYITNPLTLVPIYWFNYQVGARLVGGQASRDQLAAALRYDDFGTWWRTVQTLSVSIGRPLLVGSLLVATIASALTYPLVRRAVKSLHEASEEATEEASDGATDGATDSGESGRSFSVVPGDETSEHSGHEPPESPENERQGVA